MGWTGYIGMTASEAIDQEMRGMEVIQKAGSWRLWRNPQGYVGLTHFLTERHGGEVAVKDISASSGPFDVPPAGILNKYLALTSDRERNEYESEWLDKCKQAFDAQSVTKNLRPGQKVRLHHPISFSDGVSEDLFTWQGKYRATRRDGALVRLPKAWRKKVASVEV